MTKLFCDVCGRKLEFGCILEKVEYFNKRYAVDTECWKKMDKYYKVLLNTATKFFEEKFPKITSKKVLEIEITEELEKFMKQSSIAK